MKYFRAIVATLGSVVLLSLPPRLASATTCIDLPPLKPLHRICGIVFFPSNDRIARAKVTVLQAGIEIASQLTDDEGRFSFGGLRPGQYEIQVRVEPLKLAHAKIVLAHPKEKSEQEIAVSISLAGCHAFSLVNSKKLETQLNPPA